MPERLQFSIAVKREAEEEINAIRVFERRSIVEAMKMQLVYEPNVPTKQRKRLDDVIAGFPFDPPLWELRVGDYRIFYDVNESQRTVYVRAVRLKAGRTTAEVLR